jgi:RecA-family ATPase
MSKRELPSAEEALKTLFNSAVELLQAKVPARERLPLLRTSAVDAGLSIRDPEIYAAVAAARKHLRGETDGISTDMELDIPDATWIWDSLLAAGTLNMVTALQKVGKTALLLQVIRLWSAGMPDFLGHALMPGCPGVIIVGTDMGLADWRNMLMAAGLMEKKANGKYQLLPPIIRLWHRENPLHLDESGLEKLATICEEHPGVLILIDSFAAVTAPLGIDEFKPEAAEPLYGLCETVEPYGATTVLIHHSSKSRSGEQASNAARGSNAITAVPSQLINLAWHGDPKQDRRVELTSEGRGALPTALVIEQIERCQWSLHGDAAEIRRKEGREKSERDLNDRQGITLDEVRDQWEQHHYEMDAIYLRESLPAEFSGKSPQRQASSTLEQLERKHLLEKRRTKVPGRGEVVLYRPYGEDVRMAKLRGKLSTRAGANLDPLHPPHSPANTNRVQPSDQPPISPHPNVDAGSEGAEGPGYIPPRETPTPSHAARRVGRRKHKPDEHSWFESATGSGADAFSDDDDPAWGTRAEVA